MELPVGSGPVVGCLDKTLKEHKVQRQAYHGKAFVGNHVHKCCKVRVCFWSSTYKIVIQICYDYYTIWKTIKNNSA